MIDLFTGLRFNQSVIVCGQSLSGKSRIMRTLLTVINNLLTSTQTELQNTTPTTENVISRQLFIVLNR